MTNVIKNRHARNMLTKDRFCVCKCPTYEMSEQGLHNRGLIVHVECTKFMQFVKEHSFCMHHLIGNIKSIAFRIRYHFLC